MYDHTRFMPWSDTALLTWGPGSLEKGDPQSYGGSVCRLCPGQGHIPEPGVGGSIYKVSTDTIARRGSAGQINLGITCTGQTTGLRLIK